jgi:transcriptional regulator with XRE-family HTH domain
MRPPAKKVDPTLGIAVRHARTERGMSQEALAFASGVSLGTLGHIERGEHEASWTSATAIAGALDVPLHTLVPSRPPRPRRERPAPPGADSAVAVAVRRLREERGMTQQGLADEAYLTSATVQRLEGGGVIPRMDTMQAIADALEMTLPELIATVERTRHGGQALP